MVQAILGEQWDEDSNAQWTLELAQSEIDAGGADSFSYFNRGWAQLQLGMYEESAASFDTALEMGMPMRMLWYEFGPFEAYLAVGRYEDVNTLVAQQLAVAGDNISVEEWYYYAARAYEELGNLERAVLNYQVAIARNRNFTAAAERLQALQGG
jgi:tetratricopeptide (TPR) repeat protein